MKTTELKQADSRKTTSLIKKYLKEKFGIVCSVSSDVYSMGSSLNLSYNMGPDSDVIKSILKNLQYGGYDSMTDCQTILDNDGLIIDGYKLNEYKHVFVRQTISNEFKFRMTKFISDKMKFEGFPELENIEGMNSYHGVTYGGAHTWSDMFYRMCQNLNFVTQDENAVILKSVHHSEKDNSGVYFIYEFEGVEYNTEILSTKESKQESKPEPVEVPAGKVQIIEYSERAIAVIGETKSIKEKLKELGGKFNFRLSCGPGWIFPKTKLELLKNSLQNV